MIAASFVDDQILAFPLLFFHQSRLESRLVSRGGADYSPPGTLGSCDRSEQFANSLVRLEKEGTHGCKNPEVPALFKKRRTDC